MINFLILGILAIILYISLKNIIKNSKCKKCGYYSICGKNKN